MLMYVRWRILILHESFQSLCENRFLNKVTDKVNNEQPKLDKI